MDRESVSSLVISTKSSPSHTPDINRKRADRKPKAVPHVTISRRRSQSIPFDSSQMLPELDSLGLKVTGDSRSAENVNDDKVISLPPIDRRKSSIKSRLIWKDTTVTQKRKNAIHKPLFINTDQQSSPQAVRAFETQKETVSRDVGKSNRFQTGTSGASNSTLEEDLNPSSGKRQPNHKRLSVANIYDSHKDFLQVNRPRSRSTNVPPVLLSRTNLSIKYPLATKYLNQWAGRVRSKSRIIKTELENLTEDSEDGCSRSCILELFSRFPSSPEFAQVMHELCEDIHGYTSL